MSQSTMFNFLRDLSKSIGVIVVKNNKVTIVRIVKVKFDG